MSINCFKSFLVTLRPENSQNSSADTSDDSLPETFSAETCRPALVALFHLARLVDKFVSFPENPEAKLKDKIASFCYYKQVVDYCKTHPEAAELMEAELPLCQEMVQLLPLKIDRMRQELMH